MILTSTMLKENYRHYADPLCKIKRDADQNKIVRLVREIYETDKNVNPLFLAAPILSPSYISFDTALSYYGLIPERVVAITSVTLGIGKNKTYVNYFGRFEYSDVPEKVFPNGLTLIKENDYATRIASKEKAICDSLYKWRVTKIVKELKVLLFEDKRIDEEEFGRCDFFELLRLARLYRKNNLALLTKLIQKEYLPE